MPSLTDTTLTSDHVPNLSGQTLYSDGAPGQWARPTGIYIPPGVDLNPGTVNVVLWLHGWYVPSIEQLFGGDRASVRNQLLASGANAILIAPWLGLGGDGNTYNAKILKGNFGELFINQALEALANWLGPRQEDLARQRSDLFYVASPRVRLGKLALACHSGGGEAMRYLVGSLGRYRTHLKECWGFDCLYGINASPDDANFWYNWVTGSDGRPLYISYGPSTVPQSVKLYLMGEGLATDRGARRNPEGPDISQKLHVTVGLSNASYIDDLLDLTKLMDATTPTAKNPHPFSNNFVDQAVANLNKKVGWPAGSKERMALHYRIAKDGLLERLKAASFF